MLGLRVRPPDFDWASLVQSRLKQTAGWHAPLQQCVESVLAPKNNSTQDSRGKDREIEKWEAEVRKTLTNKAPATASLTKQEQNLVHAQLEKEAQIRGRVASLKVTIERGLNFIYGLVQANVPETKSYISIIVSLLLQGCLSDKGSALLKQSAFDAYMVNI